MSPFGLRFPQSVTPPPVGSALKALLEVAKDTVATENQIAPEEEQDRFDGWQTTSQGEREVRQALRKALLRYKLHNDQDLFDKAYGYIREYY